MNNSIQLTQIGRYDSGIFDEGAAEITAYDPDSQSIYVINGAEKTIDVLDVSDPTNPSFTRSIAIEEFGDGINSIAIKDGIVAAAIEGESAQDSGSIVFFDTDGNVLNQVTVGALPDMVTFTPDGTKVLVANEGEPDEDDPTINPEGSVSIIDLAHGVENATVTTADFTAFNGQEAELRDRGVRIFPEQTLANDVEPEYITVSPDGTQAFVSLQENNAIAVVDLEMGKISQIQPLGLKDYSQAGNGLDPSDKDGINIRNAPVYGLYQPDAIAAYEADGETYYVTANEGDARSEDERVAELELDPEAFPNAEELQAESELGRLEVSTIDGDTDGDGDYDRLISYGGRSFSIRDSKGNLVFDSGDAFAQITAEQVPELFNSNGTIESFDSRSDAKGAEPEGVVVGEVNGSTYAFVGLERVGGVAVYDISNPSESEFVQYINPIDSETGDALDLAPEGLQFISAEASPNGKPLLTVSNEISGTVSIYQVDLTSDDAEEANSELLIADSLPLEESQEVNPVPDTDATGVFSAGLDGNNLILSGEFSDLTSSLFLVGGEDPVGNPESSIHIHLGDAGENGDIIRNLEVTENGDRAGSFVGTFELTEAEATVAAEDGLYINLHTENNPAGELRGQIDLEASSDAEVEDNENDLEVGDNEDGTYTLQLLHAGDQEGSIAAIEDAPNFSAVLDALRGEYDNTVTLSSGDAFIPSPFSAASAEVYDGIARGDILIQNALGFEAIALGNHEFDFGAGTVADLVAADEEAGYAGANFPYLSANLDFSTDEDLAPLAVESGQEASEIPNSVTGSTIITVNGEQIGVVGATTPTLPSISSSGDVTVKPIEFNSDNPADISALAGEIQDSVGDLLADNPDLNKVVLLAHMQQISVEEALSAELTDVDVIVAGGSNTILSDDTDRLRAGDESGGVYPILNTDADGNPIAVVNTDGNYKYVGRLVVDFDENGIIIPESIDPEVSGAYATDAEGVAAVGGTPNPEVLEITSALETEIAAQDSDIFGSSEVFLNGTREDVRTQETNLGNLTADANLAFAQSVDPEVVISIKNGGGIRDDIGAVIAPPGATSADDVERTSTLANELAGKEAGEISQLDVSNSLRFNNGLTLLTVTADELLEIIEHGVAETAEGETPGQFPQVAGIEFSFDASLPAGDRVESLAIKDDEGNPIDTVVENGELAGDASRTFRLVTLGFLADGGDDYPFPDRDRVDLALEEEDPRTGDATAAADGTEQDALAEYLLDNFSDMPFDREDVEPELDTRIQNLAFRNDTVLSAEDFSGDAHTPEDTDNGNDSDLDSDTESRFEVVFGSAEADEIELTGSEQIFFAIEGDDLIDATATDGNNRISGGLGDDTIILGEGDRINGDEGSDRLFVTVDGNSTLTGGIGADQFWIASAEIPDSTNTVADFTAGEDVIGVAGLSIGFEDLSLTQQDNNTLISVGDSDLAILNGIEADSLSADNFAFS